MAGCLTYPVIDLYRDDQAETQVPDSVQKDIKINS